MTATRVLLFEFVQAPDAPDRVLRVRCATQGLQSAAGRHERSTNQTFGAPPPTCRSSLGRPVGFRPSPPQALVSDISFDADEEEIILYLLDRERDYDNHLHASQCRLEALAWASAVLDATTPDVILFSDLPHNVYSYLLYLLAKRDGVPLHFLRLGPAPHLFSYGNDIRSGLRQTVEDGFQREQQPLSPQSAAHLACVRSTYDTALPTYLRQKKTKTSNSVRARALVSRPRQLLSGIAWRNVVAHLQRDRLKKYYESLATAEPDVSTPFISVFLHLQPERSTVPEGGRYAEQYRLVRALSALTPDGWNIYVREHPATFMPGPKLVRGEWSYDGLAALRNVTLVSTSVDPFRLIDGARCVATVTGTVGFEAIARGVPCLVFGSAPYVGCDGVHRIRDDRDLVKALESVESGDRVPSHAAERFLAAFEASPRTYLATSELARNQKAFWATAEPHIAVLRLMLDELTGSSEGAR